MLIKGSEAGRQALTPVPKHVNFCVCGEGSTSHNRCLASGDSPAGDSICYGWRRDVM